MKWRVGQWSSDRVAIESWIDPMNAKYGKGTHWVEGKPA